MNRPNPGPSADDVLNAVRATGFLLEQQVARTLEDKGFHSIVSRAYEDPDEAKSREVDVWAYKQLFRDEKIRSSFGVEVIAECKNTAGPYVVIGRSGKALARLAQARLSPAEAQFWANGQMQYPVEDRPGSHYLGSPWRWLGWGELPGAVDQLDFVGSQLLRMNRSHGDWRADNNQIFDSIVLPMAKALRAFQRRGAPRRRGGNFDSRTDWAAATVSFPILVTTASLFKIDADGDPLEAIPVPWVAVERELKTGSLDGLFAVTVVSVDHLIEYLEEQVLAFGAGAARILAANPTALTVTEPFPLAT